MYINIGKVGLGAGGVHSMTLNLQYGDSFFTDITTDNQSGSSANKDFCSFFGAYNAVTGVFTAEYGYVTQDITVNTGAMITTVDCIAEGAGNYDCLGGFGSYNPTTMVFTVEVGAVLQDAINVGGGGAITVTDIIVRL